MLVCDTSGLIAFFDASDAYHASVTTAIESDPGPFVVSPFVIAELDYLLATRRGVTAELAALAELESTAWDCPCLTLAEMAAARTVIDGYRDQEIGLADASIVVLCGRTQTNRVLTLDHRHFRVLRTLLGGAFTLLPDELSPIPSG